VLRNTWTRALQTRYAYDSTDNFNVRVYRRARASLSRTSRVPESAVNNCQFVAYTCRRRRRMVRGHRSVPNEQIVVRRRRRAFVFIVPTHRTNATRRFVFLIARQGSVHDGGRIRVRSKRRIRSSRYYLRLTVTVRWMDVPRHKMSTFFDFKRFSNVPLSLRSSSGRIRIF